MCVSYILGNVLFRLAWTSAESFSYQEGAKAFWQVWDAQEFHLPLVYTPPIIADLDGFKGCSADCGDFRVEGDSGIR